MASHESFWLVVGAAAPVIALAGQVSIGDSARMLGAFAEARGAARGTPRWRRSAGGRLLANLVFFFACGNFPLQTAALAWALFSLYRGHDVVPPEFAILAECLGLLALAYVAVFSAFAARVMRRVEASAGSSGRRPE